MFAEGTGEGMKMKHSLSKFKSEQSSFVTPALWPEEVVGRIPPPAAPGPHISPFASSELGGTYLTPACSQGVFKQPSPPQLYPPGVAKPQRCWPEPSFPMRPAPCSLLLPVTCSCRDHCTPLTAPQGPLSCHLKEGGC